MGIGKWGWAVAWPRDARIDACVSMSKRGSHHRINIWLHNCAGEELAYCSGSIPPAKGFLRVLWLGREYGQPSHATVRGRPTYVTEQGSVTVAVALLGVIATIALWLEVDVAEVQVADDGSGTLVKYFCSFGFEEGS